MSVGVEVASFLIETLFSLYIGAVLLRLLLGFSRAGFNNPLSQFLVKITNPILVPMRRFIPSIGSIDTSAVVLAFVLTFIKVSLLQLAQTHSIQFPASILYAVGELIKSVIWIYIIALILQAVISWVGNTQGNPIIPLINSLTAPILKPIRKIVPLIGMMDLSPLVAILGLNIVLIIVSSLFRF
ncbi:MAG: YggT family protein [Cocleimonas sp.]